MNSDSNLKLSESSSPNQATNFRQFLAGLKRVNPFSAAWKLSDRGLTVVELKEIVSFTPEQRFSLADRIERMGHALTASELARLVNVSRITIFKHAAAGRIPSFRIGTAVRFDPRSIAEWLRKQ